MSPSKTLNSNARTSSLSLKKTTSLSSAPPLKTLPPQPNISQLENFALSALAPSMAVVFTLPFDTVKVRMQLQGEVKFMKDITGKSFRVVSDKVYKGSFDCLWKTFKYEGFRGLEKGLAPSILKESSKNVFRLGLYDPILSIIHPKDDSTSSSSAPAWKRMLAGGICGALGAISANPFELVKTRLQSTAAGAIAVGNQYGYTSVFSALRQIMSNEGGVSGLYRGSIISVHRGILGSAANLSSYTMLKDHALREGYPEGVPLDMGCSLLTRQPILFTLKTIIKNEGWRSLYRGFGTHFMRIGPHFCLTFVFLEQLKRGVKQFKLEEYQRRLHKEEIFLKTSELKI
ncbi:2123_t:CDS:2 [Funneliformis geosporum]|nr:2123_t:CDS:2 [Funneliformis geosporum]